MDNVHLTAFERLSISDFPELRIFRNALYFLVGILFSAVTILAYAESIPATTSTVYPATYKPDRVDFTVYSATGMDACAYAKSLKGNAWNSDGFIGTSGGQFWCTLSGSPVFSVKTYCNSSDGFYNSAGVIDYTKCINVNPSCPSGQGWTVAGSTCTRPDCTGGTTRASDGTCVAACPAAGVTQDVFLSGDGSNLADSYCDTSDCRQNIKKMTSGGYQCSFGTGGVGLCRSGFNAVMVYTGERCTALTPPAPASVQDQGARCPAGYGIASSISSGFVRCLPPGTSTSSGSKTIGESGGAQSTATKVDKETTCYNNGECVTVTKTTTTVTKSDESPTITTSTSSASMGKGDFCAANPSDKACTASGKVNPDGSVGSGASGSGGSGSSEGSGFNGACGAEPACTGDAVQCVQAKEIFKVRCQNEDLYKKEPTDKIVELFDQDNPGGKASDLAAAEKALNKDGSGDFDIWEKFQQNQRAYIAVSGSCPAANLHFSFKGHDFDLSQHTDMVCQLGQFVKLLIHIMAYMVVLKMILKPLG